LTDVAQKMSLLYPDTPSHLAKIKIKLIQIFTLSRNSRIPENGCYCLNRDISTTFSNLFFIAIALTDGPDIDGNIRMFNPVCVFF
jgi:hypothetical protein